MIQELTEQNKKKQDAPSYHRTRMQKEMVIQKLKERGCRITKQRLTLLDIILEEECSCCKEIYYRASKVDPQLGTATVYRMINTLEEIGAISRKNMYKIACDAETESEDACTIELDDNSVHHLSAKKWNSVILAGLKAFGYADEQQIRSITVQSESCE